MSISGDDKVKLCAADGQSVEVSVEVARMSETIRNLIEDAGIDNPIPLPNISFRVLEKAVIYCQYHTEHPDPPKPEGQQGKRTDDISPWDQEFCQIEQDFLFEMILGANYLDIKTLLDVLCKTVANKIKGKTPEEIKIAFKIKDDFTPEEEEQVRKENEWLEER